MAPVGGTVPGQEARYDAWRPGSDRGSRGIPTMTKTLVVVESPAKAKTIEKYLGGDYAVRASYGHIRDLGKGHGGLGVDVEHGFVPDYVVPKDSKRHVTELKRALKGADDVILATDYDREGEA